MNIRQIFQQHLAPTSPAPLALHIVKAEGSYLYQADGKRYLDLIGGISVCNVGHCHPKVVAAIKQQADEFLHVMVYGELIQSPQTEYAQLLAQHLPPSLNSVYFTSSGAEATEGALKLARRLTGKTKIISAHNAYHGNTTGALAVMGSEYWRNAYRPLMPGVRHYNYNSAELLAAIDDDTAAVILESVQGEAGVIRPDKNWFLAVRNRCTETGTQLILDEIQTGFGRTGKLWGFQHTQVVPDIVLLGKALGGGLPLGAFISSTEKMSSLATNPVLGHITTFGGHPLSCAAGLAAFRALLDEEMIAGVARKSALFHDLLVNPEIREIRSAGLLMAVELENAEKVMSVLTKCLENGLFSDWFLFAPNCIRIAPPLTISEEEIREACRILLACL